MKTLKITLIGCAFALGLTAATPEIDAKMRSTTHTCYSFNFGGGMTYAYSCGDCVQHRSDDSLKNKSTCTEDGGGLNEQ